MSDSRASVSTRRAGNEATAAFAPSARASTNLDKADAGSVVLRGMQVALESEVGAAFVTDCCRHTEGLLTDADVKSKWGLTDPNWENLASNEPLLDAVRVERERRILNNVAAREAAQRHFVKAPAVLNKILTDEDAPPRHRIEAARELRQAASNGTDIASGTGEKFIISIDLGAGDKIHHELDKAPRPSSQTDEGELR